MPLKYETLTRLRLIAFPEQPFLVVLCSFVMSVKLGMVTCMHLHDIDRVLVTVTTGPSNSLQTNQRLLGLQVVRMVRPVQQRHRTHSPQAAAPSTGHRTT